MYGAPGEIRTPDHLVRSQVLYPTELRAPRQKPYILAIAPYGVKLAQRWSQTTRYAGLPSPLTGCGRVSRYLHRLAGITAGIHEGDSFVERLGPTENVALDVVTG